jgi:NADH:ubiquinone oxidoreductase subunit C
MFFCFSSLQPQILFESQQYYKLFFLFSKFLKLVLKNFLLIIRFHFFSLELITSPNKLFTLFLFLKKTYFLQLSLLLDIVTCDYLHNFLRFSLTYISLSIKYNIKLYITTFANTFDSIPSIIKIFKNANWLEREVWDLFGIFFLNHTDLRRILTDYGFYYFPLRKDFPLSGFTEISYSDIEKKIVYSPITFTQNYRFFSLKGDWFS